MSGKEYGYARVSSKEQNLNRQIDALTEFGLSPRRIYSDKASGKDFNRPQYRRLLRRIEHGDTIVIKSIDRLGRNYEEIIQEWRCITKTKGVYIVVLDMPLLDTRASRDNLTGRFIADIVLQILSYVAETERHNIRKRQTEGIAAARARGVKLGRPRKTLPDHFEEISQLIRERKLSYREAAAKLNVSPSWLYCAMKTKVSEPQQKKTGV